MIKYFYVNSMENGVGAADGEGDAVTVRQLTRTRTLS